LQPRLGKQAKRRADVRLGWNDSGAPVALQQHEH